VVHEYERIPYLTDSEKTIVAGQYLGLRLIYAANVPYDYPALNPELRLP
jgi:hypothetical protein